MRFDLLFESIIRKSLGEGGNAIANVDRIEKKLIASTVNDFKRKVLKKFFNGEDPGERMFLLGSTGKKPDSGDIDIGIDSRFLPESNDIMNLMKLNEICARQGINSCINTISFNMLHAAFPQHGSKKFVQIDVLLTKNPEFTKFFMFSPEMNESRYKGAHRNVLLNAILYAATFKLIIAGERGEPLKWSQLSLNDTGLYKEVKTLIDSNGSKLHYKDTDEDLEMQYAKTEKATKISDDPEFVVKYILGESFSVPDANSFESIYQIVTDNDEFKYKNLSAAILTDAKNVLWEARKRLVMPDELKRIR